MNTQKDHLQLGKNVLCLFYRVLEHQIQELVQKLLDGQGLPLIKPPALRRMAGYEKTRVMVLRQLETELGVRRPGDLKMATDSQILPVVSTRTVSSLRDPSNLETNGGI